MTNEQYVERTLAKIQRSVEFYGKRMFRPLRRAESVVSYATKEHLRVPPDKSLMKAISEGTQWGEEYGNLWLETEITIPQEAEGCILCAIPDANAVEILCFKDGKPAGIINSKNHFLGGDHSVMFISPRAKAGETVSLAFECYAGHGCLGTQPFDNDGLDAVTPETFRHVYNGISFYTVNTAVRDCAFDLSCVCQMASFREDNFLSQKAYRCIMDAYPYLIEDVSDVSDEELTESALKISAFLKPVLSKSRSDSSRGTVYAIGHSHMDTAWLWPVSETVRKCARTYSEVLTLMDMYPDYKFIQSSALHLDWMRTYYPDIFEGIRKKVAEGRYEPNGGVWVECDCNITGGEAMVRQFLYGQRFTREHFGYTSDSFWLPDTFGYNAAIPQIMRGSGVKYFFTTKLSWNDLNHFPAGTFVWRGIDGTDVICHLNSMHSIPDPKSITNSYIHVTDRRTEPMRLAAYGFGDGGGGPTFGMLEYLKRATDLEGMPEIKSATASDFMHEVEKNRANLPLCDGELYLELHRGTLTKMHDVKRNNRLAEIALHDYELLCVLTGTDNPTEREALWKILLKNQFHDILPGTCIPEVYKLEIPEMRTLIENVKQRTRALIKAEGATDNNITVINTLSFERTGPVVIPGSRSADGLPSQTYEDIGGNTQTVVWASVPAMSGIAVTLTGSTASESAFNINGNVITTPFYRVKLDESGFIRSLFDTQAEREIASPDGLPLGTLLFAEDIPARWDNWDIDDDASLRLKPVLSPVSTQIVSCGAVELHIRSTYRIGRKSSCTLDTVLYARSRQIDYRLTVDWQERYGLLKADFNVGIRSASVKNEIQFGHIDRPTTRNNSIECAKFEVCNHKWSDLSESRYGVALLNDCKYGISVLGSDMGLTLMRGGARPDPVTDIGVHTMRYALLPHEGAFSADAVVRPAYAFNYPVITAEGAVSVRSPFEIDKINIICEAVKPAEDIKNAYIVRLYECERNRTNVHIRFAGAARVYETNLLEQTVSELPLDGETVRLNFRPFEIKTLLVVRS